MKKRKRQAAKEAGQLEMTPQAANGLHVVEAGKAVKRVGWQERMPSLARGARKGEAKGRRLLPIGGDQHPREADPKTAALLTVVMVPRAKPQGWRRAISWTKGVPTKRRRVRQPKEEQVEAGLKEQELYWGSKETPCNNEGARSNKVASYARKGGGRKMVMEKPCNKVGVRSNKEASYARKGGGRQVNAAKEVLKWPTSAEKRQMGRWSRTGEQRPMLM